MAQKVKVASAQFKKEGEGKFGRWYLYEIKVEGDDKTYQYMAKSNPQNKFVVGQDVDVEVEVDVEVVVVGAAVVVVLVVLVVVDVVAAASVGN